MNSSLWCNPCFGDWSYDCGGFGTFSIYGTGHPLVAQDGGWSEWSEWTFSDPGSSDPFAMFRTRSCDNPSPFGGGADCQGDDFETM